ncbi:transcriptional regulator [Paenibacillus physcomitrellae]|uniref:Transcriptional regulator n=2 Tax=Paenibacillus physcomitrellae TaxID=1619311 RepID=A0ABQ1FWF2_9BACL|nr:metalloregulator ArsR/SmtB family transcription factor [Paenibacillus physcomitrellae]GGA32577.1 transcriptional regulator [Paenibacillus physcomitrellae]
MNKMKEMPTREYLLHLLKTRGPLTAKEMAAELGITEMAVRRHLGTLERDELIEPRLQRQTMGRPTSVYALTEHADGLFPKTYHKVALDLLGELAEEAGEDMVSRLFERRKLKLMRNYEPKMSGEDLRGKVRLLADMQNEGGYMAECEELDNGQFVLKEYNCPIFQVANVYNQACSCELDLFQSLLGTDVQRTECLAKGGSCCTYVISQKKSD